MNKNFMVSNTNFNFDYQSPKKVTQKSQNLQSRYDTSIQLKNKHRYMKSLNFMPRNMAANPFQKTKKHNLKVYHYFPNTSFTMGFST